MRIRSMALCWSEWDYGNTAGGSTRECSGQLGSCSSCSEGWNTRSKRAVEAAAGNLWSEGVLELKNYAARVNTRSN